MPFLSASCPGQLRELPADVTTASRLSVVCQVGPEVSAVRVARGRTRKATADWGLSDYSQVAELVVSELLTNALMHGAWPACMGLHYHLGTLRIEVHDEGRGRPCRRHAAADDESGRGLELLHGLIGLQGGELGVIDDQNGPGKTVYVELPVLGADSAQ